MKKAGVTILLALGLVSGGMADALRGQALSRSSEQEQVFQGRRVYANAGDAVEAARSLVQRIVPGLSEKIRFERIPEHENRDVYELEQQGRKLVIRGNSAVAMASGVYHYLKEYCRCHVSQNGDNLQLPKSLPQVKKQVRVVSPMRYRFAYNYCTHGYTMAWWDWPQWERELDRLALSGYNLALIIQGQEAVWQNTFTQFAYTKEEMRKRMSSPAYQPWQFMGNLEGFMPPSQEVIDQRVVLGQRIVQRCRELGIEPLLQGYYGLVPNGFDKKHPAADVIDQEQWCGIERPDLLNPGDPLFAKLATIFYAEQKKLFGDCFYFAADPFHEGGKTGNMNRGVVYKQIQDTMLAFEPESILVKQCWMDSNEDMFSSGRKDRTLVLDLWADTKPYWKNCNAYNGTPWLWCQIHNFGGNIGMEGHLPRLADDLRKLLQSPKRGEFAGMGIVPEGSENNPVLYELFSEIGWRGAPEDMQAWVNNYIHARYGMENVEARDAWRIMLKTNYSVIGGQGPVSSAITANPDFTKELRKELSLPGWRPLAGRTHAPGGSNQRYDNWKLVTAWEKMLSASDELGGVDSFRYDLADVTRQALANFARPVYDLMINAYLDGSQSGVKRHADVMLQLIVDLDSLTATRREWLLGRRLGDARSWCSTDRGRADMERSARMLHTIWNAPHSGLNGYASAEWSGLLRDYYLPRWQMFVEYLLSSSQGKGLREFDGKRAKFDAAWVAEQKLYSPEPQGDTVALSRVLLKKYKPLMEAVAAEGGVLRWAIGGSLQVVEWDVTAVIKNLGSGDYHAVVAVKNEAQAERSEEERETLGDTIHAEDQYGRGSAAVKIHEVEMIGKFKGASTTGRQLSVDRHAGQCGLVHKNNIYALKVEKFSSDARYFLRMRIEGETKAQVNGIVTLNKAGPAQQAIVGKWEFKADGYTYVREFFKDGTFRGYRNGHPVNWFDGASWKYEDGLFVLRKADGSVFGRNKVSGDTMIFTMSPFKPAKRF